jgi:CRISPR-associated protein (TIGR02584 family)
MTKTSLPPTRAAADYPRRALLALMGMSPAVVTETLWALMNPPQGGQPFVPTEIHIITTAEGIQKLAEISNKQGQWELHRLLGKHRPGITLHEIQGSTEVVGDVRDSEAHSATADKLLEVFRPLVSDAECAIHASMAGGRKTMGFYMGYILSLLGRPQDQLSHVLVDSVFEREPQFYFPEDKALRPAAKGQPELNARDARVMLAQVPFLRMGKELPTQLLAGKQNFQSLIDGAQLALDLPTVTLYPASCRIEIEGTGREVKLEQSKMVLYTVFAMRRMLGGTPDPHTVREGAIWMPPTKQEGDQAAKGVTAAELQEWQRRLAGDRLLLSDLKQSIQAPNISKINTLLKEQLGPGLGDALRIHGSTKDGLPQGNYGLFGLAPHKLRLG